MIIIFPRFSWWTSQLPELSTASNVDQHGSTTSGSQVFFSLKDPPHFFAMFVRKIP
jgi:hypothetical protein